MKRILLGGLAGAVVYYIWQMLAWMVLPIHGPTILPLPDEDLVRDALVSQSLRTGLYSVPYGNDAEMMDPDSEFTKRHQEGPVFLVFYHAEGTEPMPSSMMGIGLLTDLLAATIAAALLSCAAGNRCCRTYWQRVAFVSALGFFLALTSHVAHMNWMRFPRHYSLMMILDAIAGWFLVALVVGGIVKPEGNRDSAAQVTSSDSETPLRP